MLNIKQTFVAVWAKVTNVRVMAEMIKTIISSPLPLVFLIYKGPIFCLENSFPQFYNILATKELS